MIRQKCIVFVFLNYFSLFHNHDCLNINRRVNLFFHRVFEKWEHARTRIVNGAKARSTYHREHARSCENPGETRAFSAIDYDEEIVRDHYQIIANDLGVIQKDIQKLNFTRFKKGRVLDKKPNIVIVFLESVGLNRMGRMGNPLDPTPSMDMISKQGIFFNRFYCISMFFTNMRSSCYKIPFKFF